MPSIRTAPQSSALRQLKKLLNNSKPRATPSRGRLQIAVAIFTLRSAMRSLRARLQMRLARVWRRSAPHVASLHEWILLFVIFLLGSFLLLLGGCAANGLDAPPKSNCSVPEADLQPTREPPMMDATGDDLLTEASELRSALRLANKDKARALAFLKERCHEPASDQPH